jgi:hypothetical protein
MNALPGSAQLSSEESGICPKCGKITRRQSRNQITGNLTARTQRGLVHSKIAKATKTDFRNFKGSVFATFVALL